MNFIYENAPTAGLIFFFIFFLWVIFSTYKPSAKKQMQNHALIPLKEENNHE
jgi:cbb3-type cytochrome oxidase subunit 3